MSEKKSSETNKEASLHTTGINKQSQQRLRTNGGYQPTKPLQNPMPPKGGTGESSRVTSKKDK